MEHIRQFDWCSSLNDTDYFLKESDIDSCVTEQILRNKFHDPLASSDSEDERRRPKIDWSKIFKKKNNGSNQYQHRNVPGLRPTPPYPKISCLTQQQHFQALKVLCSQNPHILKSEFLPRPTKGDHKVFEEIKSNYLKEQEEYIDWAKTMWVNGHNIRALRPTATVESVYEAEFKVKTHELGCFPKTFEMAAHIPLQTKNNEFEMTHQKDLVNVDISELPHIYQLEMLENTFNILKSTSKLSVPKLCNKHPCRFILPSESSMTILPLTEVHRELAQYALDNGAQYVASESALKCLVEHDREWLIPMSVCEVIGSDGYSSNVVVMGSEFSIHRKSARVRTYRAFRHLLTTALIPQTEKYKILKQNSKDNQKAENLNNLQQNMESMDLTSDEEEDNLFIDAEINSAENEEINDTESNTQSTPIEKPLENNREKDTSAESQKYQDVTIEGIGLYNCTCKETLFEKPPPRSFKKWQVKNNTTGDNYDIIVHCSHKIRDTNGEIILEPIPEYQLDLGGSQQSKEKTKSLALSLYLRENASLMNVRIDGTAGDVVVHETLNLDILNSQYGNLMLDNMNYLHTTFNQLQGLLPGNYILQHQASHGANALLYVARNTDSADKLILNFECSQLTEADETKSLQTPPILTPVLLPFHKLKKILPCAFTHNEKEVFKDIKKPAARHRTPPRALMWPKKRLRKMKR